MDRLSIKKLMKNHFFKFGMPFLVIVLGGSFYLEQFSKLKLGEHTIKFGDIFKFTECENPVVSKYQFGRQTSYVTPEVLKKEGIEVRDSKEITLEAEYEKLKELDIDNWKQIRGPRPWEEPMSSSS